MLNDGAYKMLATSQRPKKMVNKEIFLNKVHFQRIKKKHSCLALLKNEVFIKINLPKTS